MYYLSETVFVLSSIDLNDFEKR